MRAAEPVIAQAVRRLEGLPALLNAAGTRGAVEGEWRTVRYDSREVKRGDVFVAVVGLERDGHSYVGQAARNGAAAAVVERFVPGEDLPQILVPSARRALALLAHEETGHPSRELVMAGVTGTNGKTTTAHLIRAALTAAGHSAGLVGTIGYEFDGAREAAPHTTPEAPELMRMLRGWRERGATAVAMEVSSHALALERTYGVAFDVGVFTNLTQDHFDFHGTMEAYREAKSRLFHSETRGDTTKRFVGALNADDPAGRWIRDRADGPIIEFGMGAAAEVRAESVHLGPDGTRLRIRQGHEATPVSLRLRGAFNVMNALAAYAAARALKLPAGTIARGLETVESVPGRLEPVNEGQPFEVLVDYAHTPDALARALEAVRGWNPKRLLCVFGCGGDRDRAKRPLMGGAAVRLADLVFLTSDNPRSEDPIAILSEIESGITDRAKTRTIPDRAEAIAAAIDACAEGDALLIAGKGHETYQIIAGKTYPFDDREAARAALGRRGYSR